MVTVKVGWRHMSSKKGELSAPKYDLYLKEKVVAMKSVGLTNGEGIDHIIALQKFHNQHRDNNVVFEVTHSFHPKLRDKLSNQLVNHMGSELAKKYFDGYQYQVITHDDKKNLHNHIIVNPVHPKTGRRLQNKKHHLYKLRDLSDQIAKNYGISVYDKSLRQRDARLHPGAQRALYKGGRSHRFELMQKMDFARAYSTNFEGYAEVLGKLSIDVRVEEKNISYLYPGHQRRVRGKTLGSRYDKEGLVKKFEENIQKFEANPWLPHEIYKDIWRTVDITGRVLYEPSELLLDGGGHETFIPRDYSKFSKEDMNRYRERASSQRALSHSLIPKEAIREAQERDLNTYALLSGIRTIDEGDGVYALKGREYVKLIGNEWVNTRNKTRGGVIEFIAIHQQTNYLKALSKATKNPKLMLLEKYIGKEKNTYQSFYIPNQERYSFLTREIAQKHHHIFKRTSCQYDVESMKQIRYKGHSTFLVLGDDKDQGGIEIESNRLGEVKSTVIGPCDTFFLKSHKRSKHALVFTSVIDFLKHPYRDKIIHKRAEMNVLVMMTPNRKQFELFLAENYKIESIEFFKGSDRALSRDEKSFLEISEKQCKDLGFNFGTFDYSRSLSQGGGLEIGF